MGEKNNFNELILSYSLLKDSISKHLRQVSFYPINTWHWVLYFNTWSHGVGHATTQKPPQTLLDCFTSQPEPRGKTGWSQTHITFFNFFEPDVPSSLAAFLFSWPHSMAWHSALPSTWGPVTLSINTYVPERMTCLNLLRHTKGNYRIPLHLKQAG